MPSRLLREGILDSDRIDLLSYGAEVFYRRLMSVVDDYGLFDGRLSVLKSRLYPLRHQRVPDKDVSRWLLECEQAALIRCYTVDGKPYIEFFDLRSPRASKPKFPMPIDGLRKCNGLQAETGATYSGLKEKENAQAGAGSAPPEKNRPPGKPNHFSRGREKLKGIRS